MIRCTKCGALFGKQPENCFYCGAESFEEVDKKQYKEEQVKKYEESEENTDKVEEVKEEVPKKKRGRKKKSE